jgi:hypothetical protein
VVDSAGARGADGSEMVLAELLRTKGELHLQERLPTAAEAAEKCFHPRSTSREVRARSPWSCGPR